MSETSYLGLFKHDNPATNTNKFDIETALNENWDKIDENASSTHEETNIDMQTDTSKELEITDSANAIASFNKVEGDTYQATRDGKNLCPNNLTNGSQSGITYTINPDGSIKITGTATERVEPRLFNNTSNPITFPAGTYKNTSDRLIVLYTGSYITINAHETTTLNAEISVTQIYFRIENGEANLDETYYPQIIKNGEPESYEQYGVSPSPDYPSDIRNVGDNINIHSGGIQQGLYAIATGNFDTNSNYVCSNNHIPVISGSNIVISNKMKKRGKYYVLEFDSNNNYTGYQNSNDYPEEFSLTLNNTTTSILVDLGYSTEPCTVANTGDFKIEYGEIATPYTPYNCGSIDFKAETKNKFSSEMELGSLNNSGNPSSSSDAIRTKDFIEVQPNTTYTISNNKNYYIYRYEYDKNYRFIKYTGSQSTDYRGKTTITTDINTQYIKWRTVAGNVENDLTSLWQLEKGTEATQYVSHQEQNIHFPLAEGQLLHKGDYLADDGIHQIVKEKVFNGTENWQKGSKTTVNRYYINNVINTIDNAQTIDLTSNYFKCVTPAQSDSDAIGMAKLNYRGIMINFDLNDTDFDTLEEFKSWLVARNTAGNPLRVQYKLVAEEVTPYTTEQAEAYYKLKHFLTYEGYTIIECIDEMKPDIQVNYLYNNKVNNYYGNIIYELENRLHQLEIS